MTEFKNHMNKRLRNLLVFAVGFMITFSIGYTFFGAPQHLEQGTSSDVMDTRESAPGAPTTVLGKHRDDCWTMNEAPKAELPGAAIVQFNDGTTIYTKKHVLVDEAFNEALAAIGYGEETSERLDVIALCV